MSTKKAILVKENNVILPMTRGELVLDSSGNPAFHSLDFIASTTYPGLLSAEDKQKLDNSVLIKDEIPENRVVLLYASDSLLVHPITNAQSVNINGTNLQQYLLQKFTLDERPTKSSDNLVKSGGIYDEIEEVVGVLYTNLKTI